MLRPCPRRIAPLPNASVLRYKKKQDHWLTLRNGQAIGIVERGWLFSEMAIGLLGSLVPVGANLDCLVRNN